MGRCQHEKKNKVNIQNYINIHICAQPAASVFADVYVGVKPHLCNVHTCPCTSAQKTCSKVHATLTAIKCTYIYTYTHMHTHTYAHEYTCACMTPSTRWSTDAIHTHTQNVHTHAHKHAWNDSAAATAQGADGDEGSPARLFRLTQSIAFRTSNARTSLYPLPETPIPFNPPFLFPTYPRTVRGPCHASWAEASGFTVPHWSRQQIAPLWRSSAHLHKGPLRSCKKIGGKEAVEHSRSKRARINPSPRMFKVTVHEKREVNEKRPNPATAHHTITTARHPDNIRSSALVQGHSTQFMANPCHWPPRRSPATRLNFCHFCGLFCGVTFVNFTTEPSQTSYKVLDCSAWQLRNASQLIPHQIILRSRVRFPIHVLEIM